MFWYVFSIKIAIWGVLAGVVETKIAARLKHAQLFLRFNPREPKAPHMGPHRGISGVLPGVVEAKIGARA